MSGKIGRAGQAAKRGFSFGRSQPPASETVGQEIQILCSVGLPAPHFQLGSRPIGWERGKG